MRLISRNEAIRKMANSNEYMRKYNRNKYRKRRAEVVEILGGKCESCGTTENLEVDHIDPNEKTLNIAKVLHGTKWELIKEELTKCQLLCNTCHRKKSKKDGSTFKNVAKGEHVNHAKLKAEDVLNIREKYETGNYSQRQLAIMYNVNRSAIHQIVNRITWKHI